MRVEVQKGRSNGFQQAAKSADDVLIIAGAVRVKPGLLIITRELSKK